MTALASLLESWRAEPDRPIAHFGLSIVLIDSRPHWSAGEERAPLSEYDLRFVGDAGHQRLTRVLLMHLSIRTSASCTRLLAGAPVAVSIRLTVPQAVTVWLAGPLAHVGFDPGDPPTTDVVDGHPVVSDPKVYLTCACCIPRELLPAITALRQGRHGKAKLILLKLWGDLDAQIEAAVVADQGKLS